MTKRILIKFKIGFFSFKILKYELFSKIKKAMAIKEPAKKIEILGVIKNAFSKMKSLTVNLKTLK